MVRGMGTNNEKYKTETVKEDVKKENSAITGE